MLAYLHICPQHTRQQQQRPKSETDRYFQSPVLILTPAPYFMMLGN